MIPVINPSRITVLLPSDLVSVLRRQVPIVRRAVRVLLRRNPRLVRLGMRRAIRRNLPILYTMRDPRLLSVLPRPY